MSDFVVKTSYYAGAGPTWTQATEPGAISYTIQHEMMRAAEATVVISDPAGARWQAYMGYAWGAGATVYLKAGNIIIEQPAATTVFDGRIEEVTANQQDGTITLKCKDRLAELSDVSIRYDMRKALAAGVTESTLHADPDSVVFVGPAYHVHPDSYVYDDAMSWAADAYNGDFLVFQSGMAGDIKVNTGPLDETVTTAGALEISTYTSDIEDIWVDNGSRHSMVDSAAEVDWNVVYDFRVDATEGTLYDSGPSGMRIYLTWQQLYSPVSHCDVQIYDHNGAAWVSIGALPQGDRGRQRQVFEIPREYVPRGYAIDTDGLAHVRLYMNVPAAQDTGLYVYYIRLETDVSLLATNTVYTIADTESNRLKVADTDLSVSGLGLWEGCPYCIVDSIYTHINGLVTGYDTPLAMTTNVEATTDISTRCFEEFDVLSIVTELAKADGATFWKPLATNVVQYKKTFNAGAPTAVTDTDVMYYNDGVNSMAALWNEFHVYSMRMGNFQTMVDTVDLVPDPGATSKTNYGGTRSKVVRGAGVVSTAEAEELGEALVTRYMNPVAAYSATLSGLSALRLGDELSVTSTWLNLTAEKVVITRWTYDSRNGITQIWFSDRDRSVIDLPTSPLRLQKVVEAVEQIQGRGGNEDQALEVLD